MPHVIERATTGRATCRGCGGAIAAEGVAHHRLPRIDRAERASSGRTAGFVHATWATTYVETANLRDRLRHFTPELASTDLAALVANGLCHEVVVRALGACTVVTSPHHGSS